MLLVLYVDLKMRIRMNLTRSRVYTRSGTLIYDVSFNPSISVVCSTCAGGQGATSMLTTTFPIEPLVQLFDVFFNILVL